MANITGTPANDLLTGAGSSGSISVLTGGDTIVGQNGNDTISGGAGSDDITLGPGANTASGGDGGARNDSLSSGRGDDVLTGADGNDTFGIGSRDWGRDGITDFDMSDDDGGGFTNDQFDWQFAGVTANDIIVSSLNGMPSGDAILSATNVHGNELSVTLQGVRFDQVDGRAERVSNGILCYASGTKIMTDKGKVAVEDLSRGDRVLTVGQGYQPILWKEQSTFTDVDFVASPNLRPIRIKPGAFGNNAALFVSQQHCMQIDVNGARHLIRAKHLAEYTQLAHIAKGKTSVTYHHILLPKHSIIHANGALSESFYPGPQSLKMLSFDSLFGLFMAIAPQGGKTLGEAYGDRCLPCLTGRDVREMQGSHELELVG